MNTPMTTEQKVAELERKLSRCQATFLMLSGLGGALILVLAICLAVVHKRVKPVAQSAAESAIEEFARGEEYTKALARIQQAEIRAKDSARSAERSLKELQK